jgi:hypothetical protein
MGKKSARWLARIGLVVGVTSVASTVLLPATFGTTFPQTVTCTTVSGRVGFGKGLNYTLKSGTLGKVNFNLNLSGCSVTGGAPPTDSGIGVDIDGTSRRYPMSRNYQTSKALCGLGWVGETAWRVTWTNKADETTEVTFPTFSLVTNSAGDLGWSWGPTGSRATGTFDGADDGNSSTVEMFTSQPANSSPTRCFERVRLKSLAITSGTFHVG